MQDLPPHDGIPAALRWLLDMVPGAFWGGWGGVARRSSEPTSSIGTWIAAILAGASLGSAVYMGMHLGFRFGEGFSLLGGFLAGAAADILVLGWRERARAVLDWLVRRLTKGQVK